MRLTRGLSLCFWIACVACKSTEPSIEHVETYGLANPPPPTFNETTRQAFAALTGIGADRDDVRAKNLLETACKEGDGFACKHLPPPTYAMPNSSVPKYIVDNVIADARGKIKSCRDGDLKGNPGPSGAVEIAFAFDQHGHVLAYSTVKTVLSPEATACLEQVVRRLEFPSSDAPRLVQVVYPFTFKPR